MSSPSVYNFDEMGSRSTTSAEITLVGHCIIREATHQPKSPDGDQSLASESKSRGRQLERSHLGRAGRIDYNPDGLVGGDALAHGRVPQLPKEASSRSAEGESSGADFSLPACVRDALHGVPAPFSNADTGRPFFKATPVCMTSAWRDDTN